MKFVDEAIIEIQAGNGGDGCLSFRREKYIPRGGPDGGNGGSGGSIYVIAQENMNTLVDFRYKRLHKAERGTNGMGKQRAGKSGEDKYIGVPIGTAVYDVDTDELIGDITELAQTLLIAKGGTGGRGNMTFKSSTNRAPRQTTPGTPGERRRLRLELKLLADVGLLGMPNAGKSTLIRSISHATPKVADYPFTTLHPNLGVVRVGDYRSFVMADIPGLIDGAAEGAGLGLQFLKHLSRTSILLHVVDVAPANGNDPVADAKAIINELAKYDDSLLAKPRWLVLNKIDLLLEEERDAICQKIVDELEWQGQVVKISGLTRTNTETLSHRIMAYLEELAEQQNGETD